jgi:hypothetical protein
MTDQNKSALEVIEAYKQQARARRASSALKAQKPTAGSGEYSVREVEAAYAGGFTTDGVTVTTDGKVTVSMTGSKPIPPAKVTEIFGKSRVSIPEFAAFKESISDKPKARLPDSPPPKKSRKPAS